VRLAAQPEQRHIVPDNRRGFAAATATSRLIEAGTDRSKAMPQKLSTAMTGWDETGRDGESVRHVASAVRMSKNDDRPDGTSGPGTSVITRTKPRAKRPSLYRVLILNDDYTPMEFVVHVLEKFFQKDVEAATKIMLHVHHHGIGECGVFTYEIAETKVTQVMDFARKHQHPLQCVMEKK